MLAASNRDLRQAVASGKLREDLMYRLCVIPVNVPPLRDRGDDAVLLAEMFLAELNEEHGEQKTLSAEGRRRIVEHTWPGNVRELKNVIHRAFVLSDEEVQVDIGTFSALGRRPRRRQRHGRDDRIRDGHAGDVRCVDAPHLPSACRSTTSRGR